ncbi:MAG: EAL domain-containing protein [Paralcaligenes sp.]
MRLFQSIYARMFLVICAVVVPTVAGLGYYVYQQQDRLQSIALENAQRYVDLAARYENWLLQSSQETLDAIATSPAVKDSNWARCNSYFSELLRVQKRFTNFGVIGLDGYTVCSARSDLGEEKSYLGDRGYFQRALVQEGFVIGNFLQGRLSGQPTIVVSSALRDSSGAPRAVIFAALKLSSLIDPSKFVAPAGDTWLAIVDRHGVVLNTTSGKSGQVGNVFRDAKLLNAARAKDSGVDVARGHDGKRWLVGYAKAGVDNDRNALTVLYKAPESLWLAGLSHDLWIGIIVIFVLMLMALTAGWAGTQALVGRNIWQLTQAAKRLKRRRFDTQIGGLVSGQEFTEIATLLDEMATELSAREKEWRLSLQRQEGQNEILRRVAQNEDLQETLVALLKFSEEQVDDTVASIQLLAADGVTVESCIAPNIPEAFRKKVIGARIGPRAGSCGTAMYEKRVVIVEDIGSDPLWIDYRDEALSHGLHACWSHPFMSSAGCVLGSFALYCRCTRSPKPQELHVAQMISELAAIAIEHSRIAMALTQSEIEYRLLFELNPSPMWVSDAATSRLLAVNDQAIMHYGYGRDDFLLMNATQIEIVEPDSDKNTSADERPLSQAPRRHRRKNGEIIFVEVSNFPLNFKNREARLTLIHDVTEKRVLAQNIRERDELFELLMDSTVEAIFGLDIEGRCTFVNHTCETLLGYERSELIGKSLHDLIHDRHEDGQPYPVDDCPMRKALGREFHIHVDDEVLWRKDGVALPVEYWAYPIHRDGRVVGSIVTFLDITERRRQGNALVYQATHDMLTGLFNRAFLTSKVQSTIDVDTAACAHFYVLLLDLDGFKEVNDSLGHQAGDVLLRQVSDRIKIVFDVRTVIARVGGDEFAIYVDDLARVSPIGDVVTDLLTEVKRPFLLNSIEIQISGSIGIAGYPEDGADIDSLMRNADSAMYEAKREGVGYMFYDMSKNKQTPSKTLLMTHLRHAVKQQEFVLHYQPKVSLLDQSVVGVEALIRWQNSERGLLHPSEFMSVIEISDLIHPLTLWVIEAAVRQCCTWRDHGYSVAVAVNVSARNLLDVSLPKAIHEILTRYQFDARFLEIEITESSIMADPGRAQYVLTRIHDLGVRISIDDFGTGHSSLAYLQKLPVDSLKIDQSFVADMTEHIEARAIVASIVSLAHNLTLSVIAEGVETDEVLQQLAELKCDCAQGYYIALPMSGGEIESWLQGRPSLRPATA